MDSGEPHTARICFAGRVRTALVAGMVVLVNAFSLAGAAPQVPAVSTSPLNAEQLDQLVAPIALYPDPLLAQILMAATYPLEIVEADRWLQIPANAALKADALTAALQKQSWDPSIKSLVPFPKLLHMMDANLEWTERLGDAFLAQEADVMDAVQRLRQRAQTAGALASTPQQTISTEDQEIVIEPANPEIVYVPAYNPWCIYGPWPYPDYPPFYFGTWTGYCEPAESVMGWGVGFYPFAFWAWGHFEWRRHHIQIDHERFQRFHTGREPRAGAWEHDPAHRHGVPYRDPATEARFLGAAPVGRRAVRGFAPAPAVVAPVKPAVPSVKRAPAVIGRPAAPPVVPQYRAPPVVPEHRAPPAFESFGRGAQVRGEAARGFSSRMAPVAPAPSFHAAPAPSFHGGFGGHR